MEATALTSRRRIYVAGGNTLIGRALVERFRDTGQGDLVGALGHEPNLTSQTQVDQFFAWARPEVVFMTAGLSGGIEANRGRPADFILDNLLVSSHVLSAALRHGVKKLLYLGSSCMYPRLAPQPLRPETLQSGPLEDSSAAYATAKLAGVTLCQACRAQYQAPFITVIPANAFGPHDDFNSESGHVIPALIQRMHEAKEAGAQELVIWGTGTPRREFIFAPDVADACLFVMERYDTREPINIGVGADIAIADLAKLVAEVVGFRGTLRFDNTRPDGVPRKRLDSSVLFGLGWRPPTPLRGALEQTYAWFVQHHAAGPRDDGSAPTLGEARGLHGPLTEGMDVRAAL
jgi:GDP-L-fucose synthase